MVVTHFGVVCHTGGVHAGNRHRKGQGRNDRLTQSGESIPHVLRQIIGIRAGIGQQFLLI